MTQIVNVVGGGDLKVNLNLHKIASEASFSDMDYEPEIHSGFKFKFHKEGPTVMLFSSGNYHITGADSIEELYQADSKLRKYIKTLVKDDNLNCETACEVRNIVTLKKFQYELDLNMISDALDGAEYSPEIMPAVRYSIDPFNGTFLIFRTGKVIYTGESNLDNIEKAYDKLFIILDGLFNNP